MKTKRMHKQTGYLMYLTFLGIAKTDNYVRFAFTWLEFTIIYCTEYLIV